MGRRWANPYVLKKVLHAHLGPSEDRAEFNAHTVKSRRAEAYHGVARKAETLARNAKHGIEPLIGILVVKQAYCIPAGHEAREPQLLLRRGNALTNGLGIAATVREIGPVLGDADVHEAAGAAQRQDIDLDGRGSWARAEQQEKRKGGKATHRPGAYQREAKPDNSRWSGGS